MIYRLHKFNAKRVFCLILTVLVLSVPIAVSGEDREMTPEEFEAYITAPAADAGEKTVMNQEEFDAYAQSVENIPTLVQQLEYLADLREKYTQEDVEMLVNYLEENGVLRWEDETCDEPLPEQNTFFSEMSEAEQAELLEYLTSLSDEALAEYVKTLLIFLTEEELRAFMDFIGFNKTLFSIFEQQAETTLPFDEMSDTALETYAEQTAKLTVEQLYANLQAVYTFSTTEHMQTYTNWLIDMNLMP